MSKITEDFFLECFLGFFFSFFSYGKPSSSSIFTFNVVYEKWAAVFFCFFSYKSPRKITTSHLVFSYLMNWIGSAHHGCPDPNPISDTIITDQLNILRLTMERTRLSCLLSKSKIQKIASSECKL